MFSKILKILAAAGSPKPQTAQPNLECAPECFIVFDLETTGLDPSRHEVIEVAAIKFKRGNEVHETFSTLIYTNKRISKTITDITGITKSMIENEGRPPSEVWPAFLEFIGSNPVIAYNFPFDHSFLMPALSKYAGVNHLPNNKVCALKLARKAWPGLKSYKLGVLGKMGGVNIGEEHRALSDANTALVIFLHAATKIGSWR